MISGKNYDINIKKIDLSCIQLQSLPNYIGDMINLEELYLSNNQLQSLSAGIGDLHNL